jgi:hypothetical protein
MSGTWPLASRVVNFCESNPVWSMVMLTPGSFWAA